MNVMLINRKLKTADIKQYRREWRAKNKDKEKEYQRNYRQQPENKERAQQYRDDNVDKLAIYHRERYLKKTICRSCCACCRLEMNTGSLLRHYKVKHPKSDYVRRNTEASYVREHGECKWATSYRDLL